MLTGPTSVGTSSTRMLLPVKLRLMSWTDAVHVWPGTKSLNTTAGGLEMKASPANTRPNAACRTRVCAGEGTCL